MKMATLKSEQLYIDIHWYIIVYFIGDYIIQQERPRGSIVEPQGIHQDYNSLKTKIIIAHVYDIF